MEPHLNKNVTAALLADDAVRRSRAGRRCPSAAAEAHACLRREPSFPTSSQSLWRKMQSITAWSCGCGATSRRSLRATVGARTKSRRCRRGHAARRGSQRTLHHHRSALGAERRQCGRRYCAPWAVSCSAGHRRGRCGRSGGTRRRPRLARRARSRCAANRARPVCNLLTGVGQAPWLL
jgi:hypothetical protein